MFFEKNVKKALEAFAERVFPEGGPVGRRPSECGTADEAWDFLCSLPPYYRYPFMLLILGFEHAAPFAMLRPARFSKLNARDKDRYIGKWAHSSLISIRGGFMAMKMLTGMSYYGTDEALAAFGYTVACGAKEDGACK